MAKFGFIYLWKEIKNNKYYIGSHWGTEDDGYLCSSKSMRKQYSRHPDHFRRRILKRIYTSREDLLAEEQRWLNMIKSEEFGRKYYNINANSIGHYWWMNEEVKKQISEKLRKPKSPESRENYKNSIKRQPRGFADPNLTAEQRSAMAKKGGNGTKITFEQRSAGGKRSGAEALKNKTGIHAFTKEERKLTAKEGSKAFLKKWNEDKDFQEQQLVNLEAAHQALNEKNQDAEFRKQNGIKISKAKKGCRPKLTKEERVKRSKALIEYNQTREYSDDTRAKMSGHRQGFVYCYDQMGNYIKVTKDEFKKRNDLVGVASKQAKIFRALNKDLL